MNVIGVPITRQRAYCTSWTHVKMYILLTQYKRWYKKDKWVCVRYYLRTSLVHDVWGLVLSNEETIGLTWHTNTPQSLLLVCFGIFYVEKHCINKFNITCRLFLPSFAYIPIFSSQNVWFYDHQICYWSTIYINKYAYIQLYYNHVDIYTHYQLDGIPVILTICWIRVIVLSSFCCGIHHLFNQSKSNI